MKTMFNVSFVDWNGLRTLMGPNQGRHMHATRAEAETHLAALMTNTGEDRLVGICGEQARGTFRVDAFECYDHGDAVGIYVDEAPTSEYAQTVDGRVFDALRWVAQEAKAVKLSGVALPPGSKLREALIALDGAYLKGGA